MRRVVSLWFPMLSTDRLRRVASGTRPDTPLVAVNRANRQRVVFDANKTAREGGIEVGMRIAQAKALVPDLICMPHSATQDAQILRSIATWALRYSPQTSPDPPSGIWIDATGSTHLHGGEHGMLADITTRLEDNGFVAQAAIADTPGAAHAVARFCGQRVSVVPSGQTMSQLADLPVRALRVSEGSAYALKQIGLDRIGQVVSISRPLLGQRFMAELYLRLDQIEGRVFEPIFSVSRSDPVESQLAFAEPLLTPESVRLAITTLAGKVTRKLEQMGLGARKLALCFERVDGSFQVIHAGTAKPSRSACHLSRLLCEHIEEIDPGLGIEAARLHVLLAEALAYSQTSAKLLERRDEFYLAPLVDCLTSRLGVERVYRLAPSKSRLPERAESLTAPLISINPAWPSSLSGPTRLLTPPKPVETIGASKNRPPLAFVWRGGLHRICRADGPEQICGEWWRSDSEALARRDYFTVEDEDGRRYWLFCCEQGSERASSESYRWFLHGLF
ncbi:MAG: DNA polymerase Y family protein [Acetobacteraceae bacterium]|nr:DNA polymerase Y family protein [Acetobacteraceae bacterium]